MRLSAPRGSSASLTLIQKAQLAIHRPDLGLFVGAPEDGEIIEYEDDEEFDLSGPHYDPQFDQDDQPPFYVFDQEDECD